MVNFYLGITNKLGHPAPEPEPNPKSAPPASMASDEDGEDAAGPTMEAHVELAKTVGE